MEIDVVKKKLVQQIYFGPAENLNFYFAIQPTDKPPHFVAFM